MPRRPDPSDYYAGGPIDARQTVPTSEAELFAGYASLEDVELADLTGRALREIRAEVATIRELVELLVDWAGARDRVPADSDAVRLSADGETVEP